MRIRANLAISLVLIVGFVPFLNQAFHVDDTNFLALAAHAWPHPLRLYDFSINWLGVPQHAFDILANPPLIPWYLRVVGAVGTREWILHLSFLPFAIIAALGLYRLGKRFDADGTWTVLLCISTPVFLLSGHSIMPDLPLLGFFSLGMAIAIEGMDEDFHGKAFLGGLLAGLAVLCRYSGICVVPLVAAYGLLNRRSWRSWLAAVCAAMVPIAIWSDLSWWVYGEVHWLALRAFETSDVTLLDVKYKVAYQVASIGLTVGCAALVAALLSGAMTKRTWFGSALAGIAAVYIAHAVGMKPSSAVLLVIGFAGTAAIAVFALASLRDVFHAGAPGRFDSLFLVLWAGGVFVFNCVLLFASVRYLILGLPPVVLLVQRQISHHAGLQPRWATVAVLTSMALALSVSYADAQFAQAYRSYARSLPAPNGHRWFVGHWGWQYYLENTGAKALSKYDGRYLGRNDDIVVPTYPWPQELPPNLKIGTESQEAVQSKFPLRTCSIDAKACLYIAWLAPDYERVLLPFGFSQQPLEVFTHIWLR